MEFEDFITWLRRCSGNRIQHKAANKLISTAQFNGPRRLDNVETIRGLWLDNDGGYPSHDDFLELFPNLRIVILNTYSTIKGLQKYRVFIPTQQKMTSEEYSRLWRGVIGKIGAAFSGQTFDPAPKHAAAIFYLPCQPRSDVAGDAFFIDRPGELMDINDYMAEPEIPTETPTPSLETPIELIEAALSRIVADDRDVWFSVLCALHHELGEYGKALARRWSMTSQKYEAKEFESTWNSITKGKPRKPITIATVFYLAKQQQRNRD